MNIRQGSLALCILVILAALPSTLTVRDQSVVAKNPYTTWSDYGGSADSMQYSALQQIDKRNVAQLRQAWFYPVADRNGAFSFNPIVVDGVMYVLGRTRRRRWSGDTGKPAPAVHRGTHEVHRTVGLGLPHDERPAGHHGSRFATTMTRTPLRARRGHRSSHMI